MHDGLITLNWRLIQAPLSVIDYVIVHELTHRRYPSQSSWSVLLGRKRKIIPT
ncbi:M48 metallopeptidase family protein [Methylacidiphilum kamchatkense]|uniref:M48 metallopeptidase family protein n=1 Tax=Methylacidiphilum kamchatkense TaxID=431057 RepID=UPI00126A5A52